MNHNLASNRIKLGLIDFGAGCSTMAMAITNIIEYAETADELCFSRFWLGEHYLTNQKVWFNPEVYLPLIAGSTSKIKIGAAGLLMAYHNPYRVALFFKQLSNIFPGRIDLGMAKGKVPTAIITHLSPDLDLSVHDTWKATYDRNVASLLGYLRPEHDSGPSLVPPSKGSIPDIWALGSSFNNTEAILSLNCCYSRSLFHTKVQDMEREIDKLAEYRLRYYESYGHSPKVNIAVAGLCAENDKKAKNRRDRICSSFIIADEIVGSPSFIHDTISHLCEQLAIDEVIFLNIEEEPVERLKGIELLAQIFNLNK